VKPLTLISMLHNHRVLFVLLSVFCSLLRERATAGVSAVDPFLPYLEDKAPEIIREVPDSGEPPAGVTLRRVVFLSRRAPSADGVIPSEIFAVIATPKAPGKHPGMLVLHGGGGSAELDKAIAWAQRGYVAVAPDLPGIAEPKKLTQTSGW
jgi:hypothetical protein